MSTENEGTAVPPAPSAPPVPVDTPAASAQGAAPGGGAPTAPLPPVPHGDPGAPVRHPAHAASNAPYEPAAAGPGAGAFAASGHDGQTQGFGAPGQAQGFGEHGQGAHGQAPGFGEHGQGGAGQHGPGQGAPGTPSAAEAGWPPPPATPSYADGGGSGPGGWGSSYQQPAPGPKSGRGGLVAAILVAALVAGGVGGGLGYTLAKDDDGATDSTTVSAADGGGDFKRDAGTVAGVANAALPSTVTIEAESSSGEGGTGTGFVFDKQGHILTNNHVVAEAVDGGKLSATFPNGKKYNAEVIGHAQGYDVAVIKLKNAPSDLKPLALGNSDKVAVGDSTIAIGAPFGLSNTVTTGIISAKNRPVASSDGSSGSKASYMSALQTDASINPGNSGGPLLDAKGAVIGINSAIQSTGGGGLGGTSQSGSIGLGFAIPVNQAKFVAQQLIRTGKPVYAKIGASVTLEEGTGGAKISEKGASNSEAVEAGGPADKAGLKPGDVITKLDDLVIDSGPTLIGEIWTHKPGDTVKLTYTRDGKTRTADVTLGERRGDS
ncbi:trypsin-like peptidase domain-containing protein [Streptomyces sp. NPDC005907]|uniref:S1C family serine protease n=1 Tax=Streptomyces sp. NPDC005907 TaxID=3154571 RepID=UPI0033FE7353